MDREETPCLTCPRNLHNHLDIVHIQCVFHNLFTTVSHLFIFSSAFLMQHILVSYFWNHIKNTFFCAQASGGWNCVFFRFLFSAYSVLRLSVNRCAKEYQWLLWVNVSFNTRIISNSSSDCSCLGSQIILRPETQNIWPIDSPSLSTEIQMANNMK